MEIIIEEVGKALYYEHYHNEYWLDGELLTTSHYDKDQKLHIADFKGKSFYAKTPEGIALKIEKKLNSLKNEE